MRQLSVALTIGFLYFAGPAAAQLRGVNALPHVIVYKAKASYRNLVPVTLSADKKSVVSFPGPGDLKTGGAYALPVLLHKGYFLDRRGVGVNTAFVKLTYDQYASLKDVPSPEELYGMIVDKNPITELCDCGVRTAGRNSEDQLNGLIDKKQLKKKCKSLK